MQPAQRMVLRTTHMYILTKKYLSILYYLAHCEYLGSIEDHNI